MRRLRAVFYAACAVCLWTAAGFADNPAARSARPRGDPADTRWEATVNAFAIADRDRPPPPGGVLFIGSSSIRLWNDLEKNFSAPVINRGFGGSRMSDCTRYLERLVIPYRPRLVLVYAGENDLAGGKSPQDVLRSFTSFVEGIRKELPETRIAYISIKPSPARRALMGEIREANRLILRYVAGAPNLDFIDVFTPMLDADELPRAELFRADALHLNGAGYALWKRIIAPYVR
ncbi:MAG TPA: SGNH/GDSL hydrolase family protein [Candidatus Eisenbacteria bacterium]|nr:SGNH/GDSL hydrolase family protein [Candidatus Eisenbacteria bacterium]